MLNQRLPATCSFANLLGGPRSVRSTVLRRTMSEPAIQQRELDFVIGDPSQMSDPAVIEWKSRLAWLASTDLSIDPFQPWPLILCESTNRWHDDIVSCLRAAGGRGVWWSKARVWMRPWQRSTPAWEYQRCQRKPFATRGSVRSSTPGCLCFLRSDSECSAAGLHQPVPGL